MLEPAPVELGHAIEVGWRRCGAQPALSSSSLCSSSCSSRHSASERAATPRGSSDCTRRTAISHSASLTSSLSSPIATVAEPSVRDGTAPRASRAGNRHRRARARPRWRWRGRAGRAPRCRAGATGDRAASARWSRDRPRSTRELTGRRPGVGPVGNLVGRRVGFGLRRRIRVRVVGRLRPRLRTSRGTGSGRSAHGSRG